MDIAKQCQTMNQASISRSVTGKNGRKLEPTREGASPHTVSSSSFGGSMESMVTKTQLELEWMEGVIRIDEMLNMDYICSNH